MNTPYAPPQSLPTDPIALASDHAGVRHKAALRSYMEGLGRATLDLGPQGTASVDYPDYALKLAEALRAGRARLGVLICGTGIGVSIAANKRPGIRAALCHDPFTARMSRAHNDANVLCLGARVISPDAAIAILDAWLTAPFEGGRHTGRVAKIHGLESDGP